MGMASKVQRKDRKYTDLNAKQKARIAEKTYFAYLRFYLEHERMPDEMESDNIHKKLLQLVLSLAPQAAFDDFEKLCQKRALGYETRIHTDQNKGITLESLNDKKRKRTPEEKTALQKKKRDLRRKRREKRKQEQMIQNTDIDQDDTFFFIAGYTSGGAPYGLTWEEMGLNPDDEIE